MEANERSVDVVGLLQKDYARLTESSETSSLFKIYLYTLRNSTFGTVFIYRFLSCSLGNKPKFHLLRLVLSMLVPHRKDIELNVQARIGEGLVVYHGSGLVVGSGIKAGKNLTLEHGVTLGNRIGSSIDEAFSWPVLGDNCFIGCGAAVLGPVRLGSNAKVGANAVVLCDVPENCSAVGIPAKILYPK
ncbi:serine O-acetyltransferase [Geobacter argillaceus]|uniref:Serine acetyltransferase n=1 Tax=Geobacter argillaceus TaxID=345631 RepID=A0A562VHC3_9BACT|nr:serine acetyltransferase [Geobacter argillaceus]TWJ17315.1 serine O-acetyltransferase [Geobacter argillaceus]